MAEKSNFIDRLRTQIEHRNLNDRAQIEGPLGMLMPPTYTWALNMFMC